MRRLASVFFCCVLFGEGPFSSLSFEQVLTEAAKEHRIVLIDFYTTWCGPCKQLDQTTWKDKDVLSILGQKTIALKIDAEKEIALSKKYGINAYPTILLLKSDGSVLDRMVGYQAPGPFITSFQSSLAGKNSLLRAQEAVAEAQEGELKGQIDARYKLARILAQQGTDGEALNEFLWLYDVGMKQGIGMAGVRLSFLLSDIQKLGAHYPAALEALRQRRDVAKEGFLASPVDRERAMELVSLNSHLNAKQASMDIYDQLPAGSPGRMNLGNCVWEELVAQQRYVEAAELRPLKAFYTKYDLMESMINNGKNDIERQLARGAYLGNSALEIEALAGAGNLEDASGLLKKCISLDATPATRSLLLKHLERAGHSELLH